jgi:hypothetical protein
MNGGQFYFATERGRAGYEKYRRDFAKLIWQLASPKWNFDEATFDRSAAPFDNPDHVSIVIHNYRWRLGLAEGEPIYDDLEKRHRPSAGQGGGERIPPGQYVTEDFPVLSAGATPRTTLDRWTLAVQDGQRALLRVSEQHRR